MRSRVLLAASLGFMCIAPACASLDSLSFPSFSFPSPAFQWTRGEHHWRIDGEKGAVEWIEITHGLCDATAEFDAQMSCLLAGARVFPPCGGFMSLDLEGAVANESLTPSEETFPPPALIPTLRVVEARLVLDDEGRPTLWRRIRFEHASAWLRAFEHQITSSVGENEAASCQADMPAGMHFGAHYALAQGELFKLDGNAFVVEAQMDAETARRWIETFRDDPADPKLRPPAEIAFDGQTLRVRFAPDESGWIGARTYSLNAPGLDDAEVDIDGTPLTNTKLPIEPSSTYLQLRREAGLDAGS